MHEVMIRKWNHYVETNDDVVIAGDFIHTGNLEKIKSILDVLNGRKWLVYGNHILQNVA
jgi:calcineurin-like phosphoesterase family protein